MEDMMYTIKSNIVDQLNHIKSEGLTKDEWPILSAQSSQITVAQGEVVNFCANNYLGLANHPDLVDAAKRCLDNYGFGTASVRFICGTFDIHHDLEKRISQFLGTDDTILYSSCYEANEGLFETLLTKEDAIISDQLNHASIIDGVRLCKAKRYRYQNSDMNDLETQLKQAHVDGARYTMIATDGVFSMDGYIANLSDICDLAEKYHAMVMVDDSHATGFIGQSGRGTPEFCHVMGRVDIITSTMGKALGGAAGGFTSGHKDIIRLLRQRSRPYLFSNALPPMICAATMAVLDLIENSNDLRDMLAANTDYFRMSLQQAGLNILPGQHPITPIMFGNAKKTALIASELLKEGIYVKGFSYPVVPKDAARIRCQVSAAHTREQLNRTVDAFTSVCARF